MIRRDEGLEEEQRQRTSTRRIVRNTDDDPVVANRTVLFFCRRFSSAGIFQAATGFDYCHWVRSDLEHFEVARWHVDADVQPLDGEAQRVGRLNELFALPLRTVFCLADARDELLA
jgi:hypothetical protein